jgi:hypothetical protein
MPRIRGAQRLAFVALLSSAVCFVPGASPASANGTCSSVSYVDAAVAGTGTLAYTVELASSKRIIGFDVHQSGTYPQLGAFAHFYSDSGSNRFDTIDFYVGGSYSLTGILLVQYC